MGRSRRTCVLAAVAAAIVGAGLTNAPRPPAPTPSPARHDAPPMPKAEPPPRLESLPKARVDFVLNGDTLIVETPAGRRATVVLIGVDAPEAEHPERPDEPFGPESLAFLRNLLDGEDVWVRAEGDAEDPFSRRRLHLYRVPDGLWINLEAVRQGYARFFDRDAFAGSEAFAIAQQRAQAAGKGLWRDAADAPPPGDTPAVVRTRNGRKYHLPSCEWARNPREITLAEAKAQGLEPCNVCDPPR